MRASIIAKTTEDSRKTDLGVLIDSVLRIVEHGSVLLGQAVGLKPEKIENVLATNVTKFAAEIAIDSFGMAKKNFLEIAGQVYDRMQQENREDAAMHLAWADLTDGERADYINRAAAKEETNETTDAEDDEDDE